MRMPPIPDDFFSLITHEQRIALNQKQQFGWFVKFVRRPLFQPIEVVLSNPEGSEFLLLETDGITRPFLTFAPTIFADLRLFLMPLLRRMDGLRISDCGILGNLPVSK